MKIMTLSGVSLVDGMTVTEKQSISMKRGQFQSNVIFIDYFASQLNACPAWKVSANLLQICLAMSCTLGAPQK